MLLPIEIGLVENTRRPDLGAVAGSRDPDLRDPAVSNPKRVERLALGAGQDRDVALKRDPGSSVEQRPGGNSTIRVAIEHHETVWSVGRTRSKRHANGVPVVGRDEFARH